MSRTCSPNVSPGSSTAAKPPCAHAVLPASNVSFVIINTSRTGRAANAAASPAAPEPSTTTSTSRVQETAGAASWVGTFTGICCTREPVGTVIIPSYAMACQWQSCALPKHVPCRQCRAEHQQHLCRRAMNATTSLE